jgi:DNA-3-methyladenine glycosylase
MFESNCLPESFYNRPVVQVAQDLLGMKLVRLLNNSRLEGIILETEAYQGEEDLACHAHVGLTRRNAVMYGLPGRAYVYFTYGMHWLLNCVCEQQGYPAAVLIRALLPVNGLEEMAVRRSGRPQSQWTDGPAKICQAMEIDGKQNGVDLSSPADNLFIEYSAPLPGGRIIASPRIGINRVPEPWRSIPWRFQVDPVFSQQRDNQEPYRIISSPVNHSFRG